MSLKDPDRHELPGVLTRTTAEARDTAKEVLARHGWNMSDFLAACIALLPLNTRSLLEMLEPHRPPERKGRPRRPGPNTGSSSDESGSG